MNLVIHAHTFKNEPLPQVIVGNFDVAGGSIGRAPTNTLTLPDPDRHISRSHAQIICNDGDFLIRNVSSANPIAVDGRVVLPGEVVSLGHCVEILMGSYALQAKRITATLTTGSATSNRDAEPEFAAPPSSATPSQIAAFSELVREHGVAPTIDEWPSIIEPAEAGLRPVQEVPTSWFKFGAKPDAQVAPAVVPAQLQATGILQPVHHMAETTMPAVRVPSPREMPFAATPPRPMPPIPGAAAGSDSLAGALLETPEPPQPPDIPLPELCDQNAETPARQASPAELWAAFCAGAKASMDLPQGLDAETMHMLGQVLHHAMDGTLKLVALRTAAKQDLRAQVTTIQSRNNNPVKFAPDAGSAIEQLLQPARGFMVGRAAMIDAMDDLVGHASGTMSGMRAALSGALQRFEPKLLESKLSSSTMLDTLLPMNRRAKLWELYLEHHQRIQNEAEEDFHEVFGKAFMKAYDEQIERLRTERKK
jgi:FHA domain-containing protein